MILIKDCRKSYGGFIAVDGISLDVSRGEVFGLHVERPSFEDRFLDITTEHTSP